MLRGERIPQCASYLANNMVFHVADMIPRMRNGPRGEWGHLLDAAFERARETLRPERIRAILGPVGDDWTQEAYSSAIRLSSDAIASAVRDNRVWDGRRTLETRKTLLCELAQGHISRWSLVRGIYNPAHGIAYEPLDIGDVNLEGSTE